MDGGLPIRHPIIIAGESSQLSVSPSQNSDPVRDVGMSVLSEQKNTLLENLQIPPEERRLSHVLPSLKGPHPVGRSSIIIQVPENYPANCNKEIGVEIFAPIRNECTNKVLLEMIKDNFKRIKGMRFEDIKKAGGDTSTLSRPKLNKEQIQTLRTHS
jgi:hypothetical protein